MFLFKFVSIAVNHAAPAAGKVVENLNSNQFSFFGISISSSLIYREQIKVKHKTDNFDTPYDRFANIFRTTAVFILFSGNFHGRQRWFNTDNHHSSRMIWYWHTSLQCTYGKCVTWMVACQCEQHQCVDITDVHCAVLLCDLFWYRINDYLGYVGTSVSIVSLLQGLLFKFMHL